ncbi:hypothetical protein ACFL6S_03350 [Candidatus Poribacteria bacterium]
MAKNTIFIAFALGFSMCLLSAFGQSAELLQKSESLLSQGDFYQALLALEPLITADQRNHDQEQALWLANALCEIVVRDGEFSKELEERRRRGSLEDPLKQKRIAMLNEWGADIGYNPLGGIYDYRYGFLKRLVELYPDSRWRPAAEYYLIRKGYNESERVGRWLNELHSYVDKNADSGLGELYAAYLDIAHINDNLWQLLTYPDEVYSAPFSSGDPELDKEKAAQYKAEALKYYAKAIIGGYGGRFGYPQWFDTRNRFQKLKQDEKINRVWIIYD